MGNTRSTAWTIFARAEAGLISARAKRLVVGGLPEDDALIPVTFWHAKGNVTDTIQNWQTGDFKTRAGANRLVCQAFGVEFWRADIVAMLPASAARSLHRSQPGNYAPAIQCLRELSSTTSCTEREAEEAILRHCRAGLVPARCQKMSWQIVSRYGREHEERVDEAVPDWFWDHCLDDSYTVLNWHSGRFAGRGAIDGDEYRAVITNVEFEFGAIVEIGSEMQIARPFEATGPTVDAPTGPSATNGAGRRRSDAWQSWVAELAAYVHNHGIPDGVGSQGQEQVIDAVAEALAKRGRETLGRSTVQPIVQAVLDRLRSATN